MASSNIAKIHNDEIIIRADPGISRESTSQDLHRTLEMTTILQSTLDLNTLIKFFVREIQKSIDISGAYYQCKEFQIEQNIGSKNKVRSLYRLLVGNQALGELTLYYSHDLAEQQTRLVEYLLSSLLYPLRNAVLYFSALRTAQKDPLTGINNRCTFDKTLKRELDLSKRYSTPFCLLIADIDHFKQVNDSFGHLYGDCVLREVALRIEKSIRSTDILFRYGGEEFAVLLTNTPLSGAQLTAERIRHAVSKLGDPENPTHKITISIGGSELQKSDDPTTLFAHADSALYQAKRNGRNCVYFQDAQ